MTPTSKIEQDIKSIIDLDLTCDWSVYENTIVSYLQDHDYTLDEHFNTEGLTGRYVSLEKVSQWLFDNASRPEDVDREEQRQDANEILDQMQSDYVDNFKGGFF